MSFTYSVYKTSIKVCEIIEPFFEEACNRNLHHTRLWAFIRVSDGVMLDCLCRDERSFEALNKFAGLSRNNVNVATRKHSAEVSNKLVRRDERRRGLDDQQLPCHPSQFR
jgi:hypothetical protein